MHKNNTFTSIILAAGYGTRLRPITDMIPKPLIPVGDRTLLGNILLNCNNAGISKFAINTHHFPEMIENGITNSFWNDKVSLLPEKEILGTGGPVVNAKAILSSGDGFLLHNGDILTNIDLSALVEKHRKDSSAVVTMVLIDGPENKVAVDEKGTITDILGKLGREGDNRLLTYTGIACFSPEIFDYLPGKPENCSIIKAILELMKVKPDAVASYQQMDKDNIYWNDLGTVEKMVAANKDIENGICTLQELISKEIIPLPMKPLQRQGSGRIFYRLHENTQESRIAMCASDDNTDFERFVDIGNFLHSNNLGSPEMFNVNMDNHTVIMEDLGDDTLYSLVMNNGENEIEPLYRKVIEWLANFQEETYNKITIEGTTSKDKKIVGLRPFDYDYLRWETNYFKENFLIAYCGIEKSELAGLDEDFKRLAGECLSHPQLMIHRDFQSQNILIKNGEVRVVDFQGARIGNIAYDLMSLVNDPYVNLPEKLRNSLKSYYFELLEKTDIKIDIDPAVLANRAALQRNMQALGAYAFLSIKKGKKEYQSFIPRGLELLREAVEKSDGEFSALQEIMQSNLLNLD